MVQCPIHRHVELVLREEVEFHLQLAFDCYSWLFHQVDLLLNLLVEVAPRVARNQVLVAVVKVLGVVDLAAVVLNHVVVVSDQVVGVVDDVGLEGQVDLHEN